MKRKMNKYQEVIDDVCRYLSDTKNGFEPRKIPTGEQLEALLELVELHTPKKPIYLETHYVPESYEINYVEFECPNCGEIHLTDDGCEGASFCWKCGQSLNWSETN